MFPKKTQNIKVMTDMSMKEWSISIFALKACGCMCVHSFSAINGCLMFHKENMLTIKKKMTSLVHI